MVKAVRLDEEYNFGNYNLEELMESRFYRRRTDHVVIIADRNFINGI